VLPFFTGKDEAEGLTLAEQVDLGTLLIVAGIETTQRLIDSRRCFCWTIRNGKVGYAWIRFSSPRSLTRYCAMNRRCSEPTG
jgi:hypothetical protein